MEKMFDVQSNITMTIWTLRNHSLKNVQGTME